MCWCIVVVGWLIGERVGWRGLSVVEIGVLWGCSRWGLLGLGGWVSDDEVGCVDCVRGGRHVVVVRPGIGGVVVWGCWWVRGYGVSGAWGQEC